MLNWVEFTRGTAIVTIRGAYPQSMLNLLAKRRIPFWDIRKISELELEVTVYRAHLAYCRTAAKRSMCELELQSLHGMQAVFYGLRRRKGLLIGLMAALVLCLWTQQYLWSLEVQGNERIPEEQILRSLEELGIRPGTRRSEIDPQGLENRILLKIPELSWFTINANSARATVLVRERIEKPELVDTRQPCNVIASQAGLIEQMEVYDGEAVVEKGQTVLKGQLLVSGLSTAFRTTLLHHAMAEVYARTWRSAEILSMKTTQLLQPQEQHTTVWHLVLGNKLIKIFGDSSIFQDNCVKIQTSYQLKLPGGIVLPLTLENTSCSTYELIEQERDTSLLQQRLMEQFQTELREKMMAGVICSDSKEFSDHGQSWDFHLVCECREQIGELSPILITTKDDEHG